MGFIAQAPAPLLFVNVKDPKYGAKGNGMADDSAAIAAAITAATANGGTVFFPAGTYLTGTQTLVSNVHLLGAGTGVSTLKLKNGANADLLSANTSLINMTGSSGTGNTGGITNWSIRHLTLDGNYTNQTAGPSYCLRVYGYAYRVEDVEICHGYYGGVQLDWNGGDLSSGPEVESYFSGLRFYDNGGIGFQIGGPHDSIVQNSLFMHSSNHNIHVAQNATGIQFTNCHSWGAAWSVSAVEWLIEAVGVQCYNCVGEGSDATNVVILAPNVVWDGAIYGAGTNAVIGLQLGQLAGGTPWSNSCYQSAGVTTAQAATQCTIRGRFTNNNNGSIKFGNEAITLIEADIYQSAGSYTIGTPDSSSILHCNVVEGLGHTSSAATIATSGTIATYGFNVVRVTAAAAITGVILGAGFVPGQEVTVINESAFSMTFAASATSHVADGTSDVIGATSARRFVWDTGTALWYRVA